MSHTLGLQMYTLRHLMDKTEDPRDVLTRVKEIGYDAVQIHAGNKMSVAELKALLDSIGLKPLSLCHLDYNGILGLLSDPKTAIEKAHTLGVEYLDIDTLFIENRGTETGYRLFSALVNRAGAAVKGEGLKLCYHNHSLEFHKFESGKIGFEILFEETDPAILDFCLDCHWLQGAGANPVKWIKKAEGRMKTIHFKDYGIDLGTTVVEVTPRLFKAVGEGNMDWPPIVEACKEVGIQNYVVEQDICDRDAFDCIDSSYRYIKRLGL